MMIIIVVVIMTGNIFFVKKIQGVVFTSTIYWKFKWDKIGLEPNICLKHVVSWNPLYLNPCQ